MGPEILVIAIVAGVISLTSAGTSIGTFFHFRKKFKTVEKTVSKETTSITIKNEAIQEEHKDGSKITTKKQEILLTDIDIDIGSKLAMGSESSTRTGLPNKTAEILAGGGAGAIQVLAGRVLPSRIARDEEDDDGVGIAAMPARIPQKAMRPVKEEEKEAPVTIHQQSKSQPIIASAEVIDSGHEEGFHEVELRDGLSYVEAIGGIMEEFYIE